MRCYGFDEYGGPDVEHAFEAPEPAAGEGTLLVRLVAAGVNPADIKVRAGERRDTVPVTFPMAMGREAAGTVIDDPSGTFAPGALVFGSCATGTGALAESVLLDLAQTAAVPHGVSPGAAACLPVAAGTAWDALHELGAGPGDTLLVLGAGGGVGIPATQLARHLGCRVVGVASAAKRPVVEDAGAEHVESGPGWTDRVRALAPDGVDAVIDAVGGETLTAATGLLRSPGRLRSTAAPALAREHAGSGVKRRRDAAVYAELADLAADGVLVPVISATYPLADAAAATAAVAGGHTTGKVVVVP